MYRGFLILFDMGANAAREPAAAAGTRSLHLWRRDLSSLSVRVDIRRRPTDRTGYETIVLA